MNTSTPTTTQQQPAKRRARGKPMTGLCADMSAAERGDLCLLLRAEGLSWRKIALRLGFADGGSAYNAALRRALVHAPPTEAQRDAARQRQLAMLDQTWKIVEPKLGSADQEERNVAIRQALQLLDHYSRCLGVVQSQTPAAARLARYGLAVKP